MKLLREVFLVRRVFVLSLIVLCLFSCSACGRAGADRKSLCPLPFSATVEGTRGELRFCAEIFASAEEHTIRYTAPETLAGLTVTETGGRITVRQGDFFAQDAPDAKGFLAPLELLLSPAELSSVEEQNGERILTYTDGTKRICEKDGTPRAVIGSGIFYTISDFTKLP